MDARQLFLLQHEDVHSAEATGSTDLSLEDRLCEGLTDEQLRERPDGLNSIAWLLWHVTRFEDVVVNTVLRGVPEVFDRDAWFLQLGVDTRLIGTGSTDEEVADFSEQVNPRVIRAYRVAVGRETRLWVAQLDFSTLDDVPDVASRLAQAPTAITERAAWVQALWASRTGHGLLALPVIGHAYIHIGEGRVTRARLGARVR